MDKKALLNRIFVFGLLLALLAGLGKALLRPKTINYYENRYAIQPPALRASALLDGSFQDDMEAALADQIPSAQRLKKLVHLGFSTYQHALLRPLSRRVPDRCLTVGGLRYYQDYLLYWFRPLSREQAQLDKKIANYNETFAAYPETEFYVFYIEKDTDLDIDSGASNGVADYLRANLALDAERFGCFRVRSFEALRDAFYRTDHHWSWQGSYRGYREMLALVAPAETPLTPVETRFVGSFSGSKASGKALGAFREVFYAYRFDFPAAEVKLNGVPETDYGAQEIFFSGAATDTLSYSTFYGGDLGWVEFHVPANAGKGSLLLIGDSFDNAVLKLMSAHFENTYALDLRYYGVEMGQEFRLSEFLAAHPDVKVLLDGNIDYFVMDEFRLEG